MDQIEQKIVIVVNQLCILFLFLRIIRARYQIGKTYNGI